MNMLNKVTHKSILIQILKDIYSNTQISPFLGFKGGTALYIFYELDRFSVDLDFDLLDLDKRELVYTTIKNVLAPYGTLKDGRIKRFSIFFLLSYQDLSLNIKVEINTRSFGSTYELKNYLGIPVLTMNKADMFANKLVAMLERMGKANRDIYDVHFMLKKQWPINEEIIRKRTDLSLSDFIETCKTELRKVKSRNILNGIGELLNPEQKDWVKKNLLEDTIFLLGTRLH